ncbi:MAG TPA: hypothetical protein VIC57_13770 [Candidatus Dormibacteraeota bacterium]|jgi:hypothetical protein
MVKAAFACFVLTVILLLTAAPALADPWPPPIPPTPPGISVV